MKDLNWRWIKDYKGKYLVTAMGNIFSIKTSGRHLPLKPILNDRYYKVSLSKNNIIKRFSVHRIVAQTFLGNRKGLEVNHKDGNKLNNRLDNIEWVTSSQNRIHAYRVLNSFNRLIGDKNPQSKLKNDDIICIKSLRVSKFTYKYIADKFNVCPQTISNICNGRSWKAIKSHCDDSK